LKWDWKRGKNRKRKGKKRPKKNSGLSGGRIMQRTKTGQQESPDGGLDWKGGGIL